MDGTVPVGPDDIPRTTNMLETWPTMTVMAMDGHPAPLSVNCVKTALADCFGASTSSVMMTGKKAKMCTVTKMPSASGRCLAAKTLKSEMQMTEANTSSVPCHLCGVYDPSLSVMSPWRMSPMRKASRATMLCQDTVDSQPKWELSDRHRTEG